jgi:hypothetical protein
MDYRPGITITNRIISGFPISIGTSQALESLFPPIRPLYDKDRIPPESVNVSMYDSVYINLNTLFRNFVSAVDKTAFETASVEDITATLEEEIDTIKTIFQMNNAACAVVFYHSTYKDLYDDAKSDGSKTLRLRLPTTAMQLYYEKVRAAVIKHMEEHTDSILKLNGALKPREYDRSLVLTHVPYDLIDFRLFAHVDLLESNTGIVKPRARWNTKYAKFGEADLSMLPFNKKLLYCFGDRAQIHPSNAKLRQAILDIAVKRKWHPMTTMEKITLEIGIESLDPILVAIWKAL